MPVSLMIWAVLGKSQKSPRAVQYVGPREAWMWLVCGGFLIEGPGGGGMHQDGPGFCGHYGPASLLSGTQAADRA